MNEQLGYFHSVETFGTVDGPGIRYVLFLSGCALQCRFCHNPDTWGRGRRTITVAEVMADIARYRTYYQNAGGGLTVSGGEPLLQPEFVRELMQAAQAAGMHTLLDTSGHGTHEALTAILPYTDMVQFSIKAVDPAKHKQLTADDNERIFANLRFIAAQPVRLVIRYVLLPGITDTDDELCQLAQLLHSLPGTVPLELLPYHSLGTEKWAALDMKYSLTAVRDADEADVERAAALLRQHNVTLLHQ